jgi:simple sugar transport system permease protein
MDLTIAIITGLIVAATPLVLAALGELIVEKSGVLNLGVEGMMIIGAIAGFAAKLAFGSYIVGFAAAMVAGAAMAMLFAVLVLYFLSNQVATGLALTLFGLGVSALVGQGYSGKTAGTFPRLEGIGLPGLDIVCVLAVALAFGVAWWLQRTRAGLILRAVGENHDAAHAIGYPVRRVRFLAVMFGGAMAGAGGAYLSLVQTPFWAERMTAGRGWIALALVVFAAWLPLRVLAGALLFGGITILQLHSQAFGLKIDAQLLSMLPYLATIAVLVAISREGSGRRRAQPQSLGKAFYAAT